MNIEEIKDLISLFESSSLSELKYKTNGELLSLKKPSACEAPASIYQMLPQFQMPQFPMPQPTGAAGADTGAAPEQKLKEVKGTWVKAPFVGVFYRAASETSAPFVKIGQKVSKGDTLCIIEAMKVMNEIKAPADGVIKEIKAENGKLVQFDEEMILIGE